MLAVSFQQQQQQRGMIPPMQGAPFYAPPAAMGLQQPAYMAMPPYGQPMGRPGAFTCSSVCTCVGVFVAPPSSTLKGDPHPSFPPSLSPPAVCSSSNPLYVLLQTNKPNTGMPMQRGMPLNPGMMRPMYRMPDYRRQDMGKYIHTCLRR